MVIEWSIQGMEGLEGLELAPYFERRSPTTRSDGVPVGIDIDSFPSEIVDLTKLEAEGPIFGIARLGA